MVPGWQFDLALIPCNIDVTVETKLFVSKKKCGAYISIKQKDYNPHAIDIHFFLFYPYHLFSTGEQNESMTTVGWATCSSLMLVTRTVEASTQYNMVITYSLEIPPPSPLFSPFIPLSQWREREKERQTTARRNGDLGWGCIVDVTQLFSGRCSCWDPTRLVPSWNKDRRWWDHTVVDGPKSMPWAHDPQA